MALSKSIREKRELDRAENNLIEHFECGRRAGLLQAAEIAEKEDFENVREHLPAVTNAPMVIAATRGIVRATAMSIAGKIIRVAKEPKTVVSSNASALQNKAHLDL